MAEAIKQNKWTSLDKESSYVSQSLVHYGIEQRWVVVFSTAAASRAKKTLAKAVAREASKLKKALNQLAAQEFSCKEGARVLLTKTVRHANYHDLADYTLLEKSGYKTKGRPGKNSLPERVYYQMQGEIQLNQDKVSARKKQNSCYVVATNVPPTLLPDCEVIRAYKGQNNSVENIGFRFLKDPIFFVSSLFLKKASRIMGLLMVMTLALLVYSVAQRRMRFFLEKNKKLLPNQIEQPTQKPTLRWLFQLMEGIHIVTFCVKGRAKQVLEGINDLKKNIIRCFGNAVQLIYGFS